MYTFTGGIPEWRFFNYPFTVNEAWSKAKVEKISPAEFDKLVDEHNHFVLDVRPLNYEWDSSFIQGAVLIPLVHLADNTAMLPKDRPILISDWAMKQSPIAAAYLLDKGFNVTGVLKGGIERWKTENLPVEQRDPKAEASAFPGGGITPDGGQPPGKMR